MSLLTIAQAVAEEVGVNPPSSIIGNNDRTAKQLLRFINREGKILAKHPWTALQKEHTFTTVASQAAYALPDDFEYMISDTAWDRDNYWRMRGGLSAQQWQVYKSGLVANTATRRRFRIKVTAGVRQFYVDPTPSDTADLVFEYVSNAWCTSSDGATFRTAMTGDTDVAILSEELIELGAIWRYLNRKGLQYAEERAEYDRQVEQMLARDRAPGVVTLGSPPNIPEWRMNVPEGNFG